MAYYGGAAGNILDEGSSKSDQKPVVLMETTSGYVVFKDHRIVYGPTSSSSAARDAFENYKRA